MGKKSPKSSPKKEPSSAPLNVPDNKPVTMPATEASGQPAAKTKERMAKQNKSAKGARGHGKSDAAAKKETPEEKLARQKAAKEALLKDQASHDNIMVISYKSKKQKLKELKEAKKEKAEGEEKAEGQGEEAEEEEVADEWDFEESMARLISLMEADEFVPEHDKAVETCRILEGILLEEGTWTTTRELMDRVMSVNVELEAKVPYETTPRCVVYRIRKFIIDEYNNELKQAIPSIFQGVSAKTFIMDTATVACIVPPDQFDLHDLPDELDPVVMGAKVKQGVIASFEEYKTELENIPNLIAAQGTKVINNGDVVMTHSYCPSTAQMFLHAAKHRNFTLYVLESSPLGWGHMMADDLQDSGIKVILTADTSTCGIMSHIDKVVMPCRALHVNGECKTQAFGSVVAMTAAAYTKPVYCVAATYQFTPGMVGFANRELNSRVFAADPDSRLPYLGAMFDVADEDEVFAIVSNTAVFPTEQAKLQMSELYTPYQEKDWNDSDDNVPPVPAFLEI